MAIIETSNLNSYQEKLPQYQGNFQTQGNNQKSKIASYLDSLYSYPPKIKIKWNALDAFNNDVNKTQTSRESLPYTDFVEDWFSNGDCQKTRCRRLH